MLIVSLGAVNVQTDRTGTRQLARLVLDRQVLDRQVLDRQVLDRQVLDRQVLHRLVLDRQTALQTDPHSTGRAPSPPHLPLTRTTTHTPPFLS